MILKKVKNEVGVTAIEYGLLSSLIAVATITGLQLTGIKLDNTYCYIATKLSEAVGGAGGGRCSSSANKSASSANGSNSDSDSSNSSADSSSSSDSSSGKIKIDTGNTPLLIGGDERVDLLEGSTGFTISGLYDGDGNPVTNGDEIANAIGITPDEYDVLKKGVAAHNENIAPLITPQTNDIEKIDYNGKWIYAPSLKNVTFTNANGDVYRYYKEVNSGGNLFMWKNQNGVTKYLNINGPGGYQNWNYDPTKDKNYDVNVPSY